MVDVTLVSPHLFPPQGTFAELPVYIGSAVILVITFQDMYLCDIFLNYVFITRKVIPCIWKLSLPRLHSCRIQAWPRIQGSNARISAPRASLCI